MVDNIRNERQLQVIDSRDVLGRFSKFTGRLKNRFSSLATLQR